VKPNIIEYELDGEITTTERLPVMSRIINDCNFEEGLSNVMSQILTR